MCVKELGRQYVGRCKRVSVKSRSDRGEAWRVEGSSNWQVAECFESGGISRILNLPESEGHVLGA